MYMNVKEHIAQLSITKTPHISLCTRLHVNMKGLVCFILLTTNVFLGTNNYKKLCFVIFFFSPAHGLYCATHSNFIVILY